MRHSGRLISVLSLCVLIAFATGEAARVEAADSGSSQVRTWLEENIPSYMEEAKMPGFSIAIVKDGETIYAEGFGSRDPKKNLPASADTLYGIGSITKSFVAIGILQLVERGDIRLTDPVSKHVPFELGLPGKPITIHHLLTHSLGIPSLATSAVALYRGLGMDTGIPFGSSRDFYRFVNGARNEVVDEPGKRFFYHNGAWRMLGHIIQEKSGMPFHRYVQEKVIDPLGMERTTFNLDEVGADPDHIVPHLKGADGKNTPTNFPYPNPEDNNEFSFLLAAGGIVSSVNEMTRYVNALIEMGAYPGGRLASEDSFETMQTLDDRSRRVDHCFHGEHGHHS
jgi:CubicO group peptidase (beta-lactamase class C family)